MALKDTSKYLKIVDDNATVTTVSNQSTKAIIGAMLFNSQAERTAWGNGERVYHDRVSYEIIPTSPIVVTVAETDTVFDVEMKRLYSVLKSPEAIEAYPELANMEDC